MKPALLSFPHISSYSVLLLAAFFFGWVLARRRAAAFGIRKSDLDNITLIIPLAGLFGARLFARLFYEKAPLFEAIQVWKGDGLVFYGGFLACLAAIAAYAAARRVRWVALADCLAPSFLLGLALGRVGCFLAGCCWGDLCATPMQAAKAGDPAAIARIHTWPSLSGSGWPLAVTFPGKSDPAKQHVRLGLIDGGAERSLPVHPVQLYEALLAASLAWLLHRASRSQSAPGLVSVAACLGYAWLRFCTEFLRADNKLYAGEFTFSQVVSLWIAGTCLLLLAVRATILKRQARGEAVPCTPHPASG
jgi:phosphatidylglycerol:prolipoprotein diacylglycerol transferase